MRAEQLLQQRVEQADAATDTPAEAEAVRSHARHYTLEVTDATDDDVHQALSDLPPQASYKLTPIEQTVDGR